MPGPGPNAPGVVISEIRFDSGDLGIYEGIWVGEDSGIPNTNGFRDDVIAALKKLEIPVIRWPGGCFADEYHWMDGIGPADQRPKYSQDLARELVSAAKLTKFQAQAIYQGKTRLVLDEYDNAY